MEHFNENGYHVMGSGKILHVNKEDYWDEWGIDINNYGSFASLSDVPVFHDSISKGNKRIGYITLASRISENEYLCNLMIAVFGHRLKRILSILLIIVMAALMVNMAVYTHIHVLPSGSVVAHAHPFSKSTEGNPNSSHQHSNTQLFLLDQMDILMLFVSVGFILKQVSTSTGFNDPVTDFLLPAFVPHSPGRAPPSCS